MNLSETTHGLKLGSAVGRDEDLGHRLEQLNLIGASLSAERDINRLLELILTAAKSITGADGGTLYRVTEDKTLRFEIVRTSSLKYYLGGTSGNGRRRMPEGRRDAGRVPGGLQGHRRGDGGPIRPGDDRAHPQADSVREGLTCYVWWVSREKKTTRWGPVPVRVALQRAG